MTITGVQNTGTRTYKKTPGLLHTWVGTWLGTHSTDITMIINILRDRRAFLSQLMLPNLLQGFPSKVQLSAQPFPLTPAGRMELSPRHR